MPPLLPLVPSTPPRHLAGLLVGLLLALGGGLRVQAQPNTVPFKRITLDDGLSQSSVQAILQDRRGFLWVGTQDGLNRYDGYRFRVYRHDDDDASSLSANWISALTEDRAGRLWIGTHGGGLHRFDPATQTFTRFRHDPDDPASLAHDIVSALLVDRQGTLWAATYGGLSRLDDPDEATPETASFTTYRHDPTDPAGLASDRVLVLAETPDGACWAGTDGGGLTRIGPAAPDTAAAGGGTRGFQTRPDEAATFTTYRHDPADPASLSDDVVLALHVDAAGTLWIGTARGGLNRLHLPGGGRTGGFQTRPEEEATFTAHRHDPDDPASLSTDRILALASDAQGTLWVGTDGGGLHRLDPAPNEAAAFTRLRHDPTDPRSLSSDVVAALYVDRSGVLWAGTAGGGLNKAGRFSRYRHRPGEPFSLHNNPVLSLREDAQGTLWVGTDGGGLHRLDSRTGRFVAYVHDPRAPASLSHDRVLALATDAVGALWVATGNGLDRLDLGTGGFETRPDEAASFAHFRHDPDDPASLSNNRVIALHEDRSGALWVGTFGGGLNRLDRDATGGGTASFAHFRHDPDDPASLSSDIVAAIYEDTAGRLWVGTGDGLNRLDPATQTFHRYTTRDGLPNNTIYGILEDDRGHLWLSTNRGLARFDPATEAVATYDASDGLQSNEFSQGAYYKNPDGMLYFGGIEGFNRFDPVRLVDAPPPVVITALRTEPEIPGLHARDPDALRFDQGTALTIEFAALDYHNPARHRYAFRLDGTDDDWHERDADRRYAAYANLPGGTYTFRVRGANSDGIWNEAGATLTFTIVPPYWATWWFRLLTAAVVLGVLGSAAFAWHRARIRRVERLHAEQAEIHRRLDESREAERLRLAQELHDGAVQDLYGVRFSLEALPDAEPLEQGKQRVEAVIRQLRAVCGDLRPPALAPFGLERAIRAHAERFQERYPALEVTLELAKDGQTLPEPVRLTLFRIYQEAMHNVAKHAEAQHVFVRFTLADGRFTLVVRDDGRGFTPPARWIEFGRQEHYGLLGIAERAAALGGHLTVRSAPGQGTTLTVEGREERRGDAGGDSP